MRPQAQLYHFDVSDQLPAFQLPLRESDAEPIVDLQAWLSGVNECSDYELRLDYQDEPIPPFSEKETAWIDGVLIEKDIRTSSVS